MAAADPGQRDGIEGADPRYRGARSRGAGRISTPGCRGAERARRSRWCTTWTSVPASPAEWRVDPFGGEIRDGAVWGRGALDMKGHGIIQLMAMIALKRAGVRLTRDLVFIGNADEEIGGLGTRTFIRDHPDLVRGIEYVLTESGDTRVEQGRVRWSGSASARSAPGGRDHRSTAPRRTPRSRPGTTRWPGCIRVLNRIAGWETPSASRRRSSATSRAWPATRTAPNGTGWRNRQRHSKARTAEPGCSATRAGTRCSGTPSPRRC